MAEQTFFPYRFAGHVCDLLISGLEVDGKPQDTMINPLARTVLLRTMESWTSATVSVVATVPVERLLALFPEDERENPPCAMLIAVRCDATRWREGFTLAPTTSGTWGGNFQLDHRRIRGHVQVTAYLVRTQSRVAIAPFASTAHVRIADSASWTISVDREATPPGGYLNVQWDDFANSDSSTRKNHPALLYHLDLEGSTPVLWLNEGIAGLKDVLSSEGTRGRVAAVRDVVFSLIANTVWLGLTVSSLLASQDASEGGAERWQQNVLNTIAPLLSSIPDPVDAIRNASAAQTLIEALLIAVQGQEPVSAAVAKLLNEVEPSDA
jgi:hypothetical protein